MSDEKKDPQELARVAEEQLKKAAARKAWLERVKTAVNAAPQDENVRILLTHLFLECGMRLNPVVLNQDKEVTNGTEYNVGRQSVWHDFRNLMSAATENAVTKREE